ncbi:MAG TPA: potassium channel family protein [Actinomycetes bacterium]
MAGGRRRPVVAPTLGPGVDLALPSKAVSPLRAVVTRLLLALAVLVVVVALVWVDRGSYRDSADGAVSLLDAAYHATVTLSTTGYGDITPVSDGARLSNVLVVTPLRIVLPVLLVGTTIEVLAARSRHDDRVSRWRSHVHDHTVTVGFGTKGRSALQGLLDDGRPASRVVVIDPSADAIAEANRIGVAGVIGDATRVEVPRRAEVERAANVIVSAHRDDTAALVVLTTRRLNPGSRIVCAVRESDNVALLTQSGADSVIHSAAAAGRPLALSVSAPVAGGIMEDLPVAGEGLEVVEREVTREELGRSPAESADMVLAVIRDGAVSRFTDGSVKLFQRGGRVVVVRQAAPDDTPADASPSTQSVQE